MTRVTSLLASLVAVCLVVGVHSQPNPDICIPHGQTGGGPPLPVLPQQFRLKIEANILGWNRTIEVVEYYDDIHNRGAVHNIMGGDISQTVLNYDTREIITVHPDGDCSVQNLTAGGFNIFGFQLQNGTAHIGSVNDIFRFGASYNDSYVGTAFVRGIPVNHWRSCLYNEARNGTSSLDYYFTMPGYNSSYGDAEIPLRLVLNGTANNARFINGHVVNVNGTHSFSHVYEFFDVEFHPDFEDRSFEPKLGVVCPGRKSSKPLPNIPDHFHQRVEVVIPAMKLAFYVSESYNYKSKMVTYEYRIMKNGSRTETPYRTLDDFNTGLTYRINMSSGFCNITPIALSSPDAESPDNLHVQIKSLASFFYFGDHDWVYQGVTQLRDMETESWISTKTDWKPNWLPHATQVNSTWEYFFTSAGWNTQSGLSKSSNMPVMSKVRWSATMDDGKMKNGSFVINTFHFDTFMDKSTFDLSPCFGSVDSEEMAFDISEIGIYNDYIANNTVEFYRGATHNIAMAAGVSPIRIANVFASEDKTGVTTVFFTVLGVPDIEGDAVNMTKQLSLDDAIANLELKMGVTSGSLLILEFDHNGKKTSLIPKAGTLRNFFNPGSPGKDDSKKFSIGAFVGFGLAMLILGVAVSVGIVIVINKKRNPEVPYNVQE